MKNQERAERDRGEAERVIESGELHSMILWGPPGSGKTTLASLMAHVAGARFVAFSAVLSGVKEIRQVVAEADVERTRRRQKTMLTPTVTQARLTHCRGAGGS